MGDQQGVSEKGLGEDAKWKGSRPREKFSMKTWRSRGQITVAWLTKLFIKILEGNRMLEG